jgi:hypothetical protein
MKKKLEDIKPSRVVLISVGTVIILLIIVIIYQRFVLSWTNWADWTGFGKYTSGISKDDRG